MHKNNQQSSIKITNRINTESKKINNFHILKTNQGDILIYFFMTEKKTKNVKECTELTHISYTKFNNLKVDNKL